MSARTVPNTLATPSTVSVICTHAPASATPHNCGCAAKLLLRPEVFNKRTLSMVPVNAEPAATMWMPLAAAVKLADMVPCAPVAVLNNCPLNGVVELPANKLVPDVLV